MSLGRQNSEGTCHGAGGMASCSEKKQSLRCHHVIFGKLEFSTAWGPTEAHQTLFVCLVGLFWQYWGLNSGATPSATPPALFL
jgi:hypothetical protein